MKTVKDVVAAYPDGWPNEGYMCVYDKVTNSYRFAGDDSAGHCDFYIICTREEYEQELAKTNTEQWYDYDKQEAISLPPVGVECEIRYLEHDWQEGLVIGESTYNKELIFEFKYGGLSFVKSDSKFRPLDYDKNKQKVVDLDWLIGSGIDCEFSDGSGTWYFDKLSEINHGGLLRGFRSERLGIDSQCRPRMNHKMVLTIEKYKLIPRDQFNIEVTNCMSLGFFIVEFLGLQDGYIYPYEKTATQ